MKGHIGGNDSIWDASQDKKYNDISANDRWVDVVEQNCEASRIRRWEAIDCA